MPSTFLYYNIYMPIYDTPEQKSSNIPDLRTTIFWEPDLLTDEKGNADFKFYTADQKSIYSIVVEGISQNGGIIRRIFKMKIK